MIFVNLTPHAIRLPDRTIPTSGMVAGCIKRSRRVGVADDVELIHRNYSETFDLPEPKPGVMYIVSYMVRLAHPERLDLASPGDLIRDRSGNITGALNLVVNPANPEEVFS